MQKPLFDELSSARLEQALAVMRERGDQYGDTMRNGRWLKTLAVAKELGININREEARALSIAGLGDIKYDRFEGGWKVDHIDDGINYDSILPGLVKLAKESRLPIKDAEFEEVDLSSRLPTIDVDIPMPGTPVAIISAPPRITWEKFISCDSFDGFVGGLLKYAIFTDDDDENPEFRLRSSDECELLGTFRTLEEAKARAEELEAA